MVSVSRRKLRTDPSHHLHLHLHPCHGHSRVKLWLSTMAAVQMGVMCISYLPTTDGATQPWDRQPQQHGDPESCKNRGVHRCFITQHALMQREMIHASVNGPERASLILSTPGVSGCLCKPRKQLRGRPYRWAGSA